MENDKVSIITVCLNSEKTIEKAILSVIGQTYRNIEYIVVDGGSTDRTLEIVRAYEDRIAYWISEPDRGLYDAMNKGIRRASGHIVGILNSDDWYEPDAVKQAVKRFAETGADIVHGDLLVEFGRQGEGYRVAPGARADDLFFHMIYNHPTVFVKADLYAKYGLFDLRYRIAADYELLLRLYVNGAKFAYLPRAVAHFGMGGLSGDRRLWKLAAEEKNIARENLPHVPAAERGRYEALIRENFLAAKKKAVVHFLSKRADGWIGKMILQRLLGHKSHFVVFGAGILGASYCRWIKDCGMRVLCFADNAPEKQNRPIGAYRIERPDFLLSRKADVSVLIAVVYHQTQIGRQLEEMGFRRGIDFAGIDDLYQEMTDLYLRQWRKGNGKEAAT